MHIIYDQISQFLIHIILKLISFNSYQISWDNSSFEADRSYSVFTAKNNA